LWAAYSMLFKAQFLSTVKEDVVTQRGTFDGPDEITAAKLNEQQTGKFGYLSAWQLRFKGKKMVIEASATIMRDLPHEDALRVESVQGGLAIEFVDFKFFAWRIRRPRGKVVAVTELKVDGRKYAQWSDELYYVSLEHLPIGSTGFVYRNHIEERGGKLVGFRHADTENDGDEQKVPVRRNGRRDYEVELNRGEWTKLIVKNM